jgi:aspartate kinase
MVQRFEKDMVVSEIECRRGYTCVKVRFKEKSEVGKILGALAEAGIHFTIPKIHENSLNFVLPQREEEKALEVLKNLGYNPQLLSGCSLVIVYAPDMRNLFGIMVQILEAMLKEGAEVLQVGDAYNSVSCLIRDEKLKDTISSLQEFFPNTAIKCELS